MYICVHELLLFYLIHLYMFRVFVAHPQEILYCLFSRYGKQKYGRALWCPVPDTITHDPTFVYHKGWPGSVVSPEDEQGPPETGRDVLNKIATVSDIKLDTHVLSTLYFNLLYVLWHLIDEYSLNTSNNHSCKCHWDSMRACSVYTMLKSIYVKAWKWLSSAETFLIQLTVLYVVLDGLINIIYK
jgi:hypothetical protein